MPQIKPEPLKDGQKPEDLLPQDRPPQELTNAQAKPTSAGDLTQPVIARLIPLIPLISAVVFGSIFYVAFTYLRMDEFTPFMLEKLEPSKQLIPELRARVFWGLAAGTFAITLLWNVVASLHILVNNLKPFTIKFKVCVYILVIVLVVIALSVVSVHKAGGGASNFIIKSIQERSTGSIPLGTVLEWLNIVACIYFAVSVSACCSLLYLPFDKNESSENVRLTAEKIEHTKLSLYLAGALLVNSVFEVHLLLSWPSSFVAEEIRPSLMMLAGSLSLSAGILFSFLLTVIYLPIAVIHKKWISNLFREASTGSNFVDKAKWLQRHELETSELDILKGFLVIIAPTVAGFITKII